MYWFEITLFPGIWGLAAASALENLPIETRGLASGTLQMGYAVGYLIAAVINLFLVPEQSHSWRALFWCAAGISAFAAFLRLLLPESKVFLQTKEDARLRRERHGVSADSKTVIFIRETKKMLKIHWKLCIYAMLLMTGMWRYPIIPFNDTHCSCRVQFPLSRFSGEYPIHVSHDPPSFSACIRSSYLVNQVHLHRWRWITL